MSITIEKVELRSHLDGRLLGHRTGRRHIVVDGEVWGMARSHGGQYGWTVDNLIGVYLGTFHKEDGKTIEKKIAAAIPDLIQRGLLFPPSQKAERQAKRDADLRATDALIAANKRVKEAAPDLLKALKIAREGFVIVEPWADKAMQDAWAADLATIDAAIAKAEGPKA